MQNTNAGTNSIPEDETVKTIKRKIQEISIIVGAFSVCILLFSGFAAWKKKKTIKRRRSPRKQTPSMNPCVSLIHYRIIRPF